MIIQRENQNIQVTLLPGAAAIRLGDGNVTQSCFSRLDTPLMTFEDLNCFLLGAGNLGLTPAARATAVTVLHEQVATADLSLSLSTNIVVGRSRVMSRHVLFKGFGIRIRRWFPTRLLGRGVEIVW
jgi:hypothetical protein